MEPHTAHSCDFVWGQKQEKTSVSCTKPGTAEDMMARSSQLRNFAIKNKNKELVFVREGRAISSHWPCSLMKGETLTIKYVKDGSKGKRTRKSSVSQMSSDELVMFHVLTIGGKGVVKILRNLALKTVVQEMTVYAYRGETVKQALRGDGRFLKTLFSMNIGLHSTSSGSKIEMSMDVDVLDGHTYRIILLDKSEVPDSQPGSLDDAYITPNEHETHDSDSQNNNNLKQEQTTNGNTTAKEMMCEIRESAKMKSQLCLQFKKLVKGKKTVVKLSRVQNLLRVEYGQNEQTCNEVKTMKKLMELSSSVCHVTIDGSPAGSGFLLFGNFVLTNAHVLKDIYNDNRGQLGVKVTVNFSYESHDRVDSGQESGVVEVTDVVGFEYCPDASGHMYDWALLRLRVGQKLPDGLLEHCGFLPQSGGICIIGHPDGGIKKIDPCSVIPSVYCKQFVEENYWEGLGHVQFVTRRFFDGVVQSVQQDSVNRLNYKSCFYFGSSGSPVFDKYCKVVAMHSGGYAYDGARGETQSVIEYGYPLSNILEHIVIKLVLRGRFDVLKDYLNSSFPLHKDILRNVKKLVESRNDTAFKNSLKSLESTDDECLKMFFAFLSLKEEPVPMEVNEV